MMKQKILMHNDFNAFNSDGFTLGNKFRFKCIK